MSARAPPALLQVVHRSAPVRNADPDALEVVASDESVDSYGDIIRASGWQLQRFKMNPIVLFGHDSYTPIGTAKVKREGTQLLATVDLADEGTSPFIDTLRSLVAQKIVRAVSVGFMPTVTPNVIRDEKNDKVTGYEYIGQELFELSVVSVPANPMALTLAKDAGLQQAQIDRLFGQPAGVAAHLAVYRARIAAVKK
jgi:HK97 family phage prohead protease